MTSSNSNLIRDIVDAMRERQKHKLLSREEIAADRAELRAYRAAVDAFTTLNGWKKAPVSCGLNCLGRGLAARSYFWRGDDEDRDLLDHDIWFRVGPRYIAAVGQPYADAVDIPEWRAHLKARGHVLNVSPDPRASFHNPGWTLFLAVTKPGVEVRWLPEQDGRLKALWKAEVERQGESVDW